MNIPGKKTEAEFIARLNRFVAKVQLKNEIIDVHVPNSGRLRELLAPGARVILREATSHVRKYKYDVIMAYKDNELISIDSQLPNKFMLDLLTKTDEILYKHTELKKLLRFTYIKPEVRYKNSRFDLGLGENKKVLYYAEIKGVTLVEDHIAFFPDAPTERGTKHLEELIEAKLEGFGAGVIFVIQRQGAECFAPNDGMDPAFGKALRRAVSAGVDVFPLRCSIKPDEIMFKDLVQLKL